MSEAFDAEYWEGAYGENGQVLEDVFDYGLKIQLNYPFAEGRMVAIMEEEDLEPEQIREYIASLYDQCEEGLITPSEDVGTVVYGKDENGRSYGADDLRHVLDRLPKLDDDGKAEGQVSLYDQGRLNGFLKKLRLVSTVWMGKWFVG